MTILDINYKHKPMLLVQNREGQLQKKARGRKNENRTRNSKKKKDCSILDWCKGLALADLRKDRINNPGQLDQNQVRDCPK